jgi:hypothetical protein
MDVDKNNNLSKPSGNHYAKICQLRLYCISGSKRKNQS